MNDFFEGASGTEVPDEREHLSLCETLDRVLNKGVLIVGEVTITVADIDLVYLGLHLMLTSVETARKAQRAGFSAGGRTREAGA
jgi:hypothetical protein